MDLPDNHGNKKLYKEFVKTMPIWSHFDYYKAVLDVTKYSFDKYYENLNDREKRIAELPEIYLTEQSRVLPAQRDIDLVKIYRKVNGEYESQDGQRKKDIEGLQQLGSKDAFKTDSVILMEQKLKPNEEVYAMIRKCKPWVKCMIKRVFRQPITTEDGVSGWTTIFRLKLLKKDQQQMIDVNKYLIARIQDHKDELKPVKRVIAGLVESNMMPGIVAEQPDDTNKFRYLVFMDDGSANYFKPHQVYPILGQSDIPWLDAEKTGFKNQVNMGYVRQYFSTYPKKFILKAKIGDKLELLRNGIHVSATLIGVDCSTIRVHYKDDFEESVYRGSPRLMKKSNLVARLLADVKNLNHFHNTVLLWLYFYNKVSRDVLEEDIFDVMQDFGKKVILRSNRNTARKSTGKRDSSPKRVKVDLDGELVDEDRDRLDDIGEDDESKSHRCSVNCLSIPGVKTEASVENITEEFRHVSDLKVPLLLGWKRKLKRLTGKNGKSKIVIIYEAPCGKIFQQPYNIRATLLRIGSILDVDYFSFDRDVVLNTQWGEAEGIYHEDNIAADLRTGKPLENKNISLMNTFSEERLPQDFEYRNESFPHPMLKKRGFSFNQAFKSGCECQDDCSSRAACHCHLLNETFYNETYQQRGVVDLKCQYKDKRLMSQVNTGIFECNSFCSCSSRCPNRVVQNGIRFRLQVTKTINKGWGVITLDDIPKGAFICTYAAELLDDADMYGDSDMYYADLDYITENERSKNVESEDSDEGVDIEDDKSGNKKKKKLKRRSDDVESDESHGSSLKDDEEIIIEDSGSSSEGNGEPNSKYMPNGDNNRTNANSAPRYPKRSVQQNQARQLAERRPVKFKKIHKLLDSHDFTLDARMQGNVGRFFNHSCDPNSFVQNVFIETHDLRFPVVSFFALRTIKAMSEINWNYNYKVNSIPGRRIDCRCGASNCQGQHIVQKIESNQMNTCVISSTSTKARKERGLIAAKTVLNLTCISLKKV